MATLDEILDAMPDEVAEAGREYLTIDPLSRTITVPESERIFAVTGDEYADRKYFRCPRIVGDGLDLAAMFVRVNFRNAGGDEDGYLVDDVAVAGDYVTFSWRLWPKVAEYIGTVQFSVCADLPDTEGRKMPDWNTTLASGEVLEGMHPYDGAVEEETSDVVTQLRAMTAAQTGAVEAVGAQQVQEVQEAANAAQGAAVAAVQAQGEATRASIPADYTALAATVDRLTRDRAAAIVCEAQGAAIQVNDASADPLQGLRIFGRSTQDGTPTPDNPVEIKSLAAPVVTVAGKNLLPRRGSYTSNGVVFTVNADGSITINGTAATSSAIFIFTNPNGGNTLQVPPGEYVFSGLPGASAGGYYLTAYDSKNSETSRIEVFSEDKTAALKSGYLYKMRIVVTAGATANNVTFYPMVRPAAVEDPVYLPYSAQALAITTPGSLPGIPVASGGNYTDENGQQWIADEVDLARGVYVQRVEAFNLTGDENWQEHASGRLYAPMKTVDTYAQSGMLSTHVTYSQNSAAGYYGSTGNRGVYMNKNNRYTTVEELTAFLKDNSVRVVTLLLKPIEHALTDAEIQAYRALHSVKPTTTVLTDTGAHMALEYAADPKTYIDNKLAALVAAAAN